MKYFRALKSNILIKVKKEKSFHLSLGQTSIYQKNSH